MEALMDKAGMQLTDYAISQKTKPTKTLTTEDGRPIANKRAILTVGPRGPVCMFDHTFMEEVAHFDREVVPHRVVHAKGAGCFGYFKCTHDITQYTKAKLFSAVGKTTPLAARFSLVVSNTGTPDSFRDVRGIAFKFYTEEGNWDLLGLNFPIFFIRDPMQFTSLIHSLRANPVTALKAPDAFWDFCSLRPETMHNILMLYTDRGVPLNYRTMHGFGVNTFVLTNKNKEAFFCKFHMITNQGIQNMPVDEIKNYLAGDPDHARRDLYNCIAGGKYPSWTMKIQIMTMEQYQNFKDFDPLDDTKVWPHKEFPLIEVGQIVCDRNPHNFHGEVEQIALNPASMVPGIEPSLDKVLQGRFFAYGDTQRYRIGANFHEIPVNRPLGCESHNYLYRGNMNTKYEDKEGPMHFPNTFSGPQESDQEYMEQGNSYMVNGQIGRYDNWDHDNFTQPRTFYEKVLTPEEREQMIANIAENLQHAATTTQSKMIEHFRAVNNELGTKMKEALDHRMKVRMQGKPTPEA